MKETLKNSQIKELYLRKYLKKWGKGKSYLRHYALIKIDKERWIWANDYLKKQWRFEKGKSYDFYVYTAFKGENKGKSFVYDYCLSDKPRELKKQFGKQWFSKKAVKNA